MFASSSVLHSRALAASVLAAALAVACDPHDGGDLPFDGGALDGGSTADTGAPLSDGGPPADFEGYVEHFRTAAGIAGISAAISTADGVTWTGAWGLADVEAGVPVTDQTLFVTASVSKTVTSLAVLQLVDQGLLDLDAPLEDYLPYAVRHPSFPETPITTRMLLTHTSGLTDDFVILGRATFQGDTTVGLREFAEGYVTPGGAYFGEDNWGHEPGTEHDYCNVHFGILGDLVETLSGQSFRDRTRERILDPLGMTETGWFLADIDPALLAVPYSYARGRWTAQPHLGYAFYPASTLRTSAAELGRFLAATIQNGALDGARVLDESLAVASREPQVPALDRSQAITWEYRDMVGHTWLSHTGSAAGASAIIAYRPDAGVGFLVLTNSEAFLLTRAGLDEQADALWAIIDRVALETDSHL